MYVAELALPVLPGLYLGPAQKFSTVFHLEVLSSQVHGVPQSPRVPPSSGVAMQCVPGRAVPVGIRPVLLCWGKGHYAICHLRRSKTGCKGTADFILLAGALQSNASPK